MTRPGDTFLSNRYLDRPMRGKAHFRSKDVRTFLPQSESLKRLVTGSPTEPCRVFTKPPSLAGPLRDNDSARRDRDWKTLPTGER